MQREEAGECRARNDRTAHMSFTTGPNDRDPARNRRSDPRPQYASWSNRNTCPVKPFQASSQQEDAENPRSIPWEFVGSKKNTWTM